MARNDRCSSDETGVSAVIGVILIMAITVVLAAVIALYAFDFAKQLPEPNNVAVKVNRINATHISVITFAGPDFNNLIYDAPGTPGGSYGKSGSGYYGTFNVTVDGVEVSNYVPDGTLNCTSKLGSMQYFSPVPVGSYVVVIGNFKDNSVAALFQDKI